MRNNSVLFCMIILIGTQLGFGVEFNAELERSKANVGPQTRMLDDGYFIAASYEIILNGPSKVEMGVRVGQSKQELQFTLETSPQRKIKTEISLFSSDSRASGIILSREDSSWTSRVAIDSDSGQLLKINIENESSLNITVNLEITVASPSSENTSDNTIVSFPSWLGAVIAVPGFFILILIICCIILRIRRNRLLRRRMHSRAAYEQIASPVHMLLPNNPNPPLAPPIQLVLGDPNSGPLSEQNFDHRFPEAPFENFRSSFPQKTCSICLEDLENTQLCRQLYCRHIFHAECAKAWLLNQMKKQNHEYCPNCKKDMTLVLERAKE